MKIDISLDKNLKNKKSIWKKNRAGMPKTGVIRHTKVVLFVISTKKPKRSNLKLMGVFK